MYQNAFLCQWVTFIGGEVLFLDAIFIFFLFYFIEIKRFSICLLVFDYCFVKVKCFDRRKSFYDRD